MCDEPNQSTIKAQGEEIEGEKREDSWDVVINEGIELMKGLNAYLNKYKGVIELQNHETGKYILNVDLPLLRLQTEILNS